MRIHVWETGMRRAPRNLLFGNLVLLAVWLLLLLLLLFCAGDGTRAGRRGWQRRLGRTVVQSMRRPAGLRISHWVVAEGGQG